jgi:signal transduction histidine kinase/CheY-like chemotaxis protein
MPGTPTNPNEPPLDASRSALEFVHRLLLRSGEEQTTLEALLGELAAAFAAERAGLATFPDGSLLSLHPAPSETALAEVVPPWREQTEILDRLSGARVGLTVLRPQGGSCLLSTMGTPERGGWLLWLEDSGRTHWTDGEAAALVLVAQTLTQLLTRDEALPCWAEPLDRGIRRQRLEAAARIVRRLAHDFGNILTGILGFSELALTQQITTNSSLHAYLTEAHNGAQNGAHYTNQLHLFARRHAATQRSCELAAVLSEEENRLRSSLPTNVQLRLDLAADLPAVAMEAESLRQTLAIVLDNAREALTGAGVIEVSARTSELSACAASELFGDVRPGTHLDIRVADSGAGLTPEAQRQLFAEPFFSTKPRQRGFGLAMAYGILSAHRGGLELLRRPQGGTIARLVVPAASVAASAPRPAAAPRNERILVVDDDTMILQYVTATLERAGFRVLAVANGAEALRSFKKSSGDPFSLVLSDVLMPDIDGIDLARRLLTQDANLRVLFMSGLVHDDCLQEAFAPRQFELLSKPFRPEGLVRAVRTAIDRASSGRAAVPATT